MYILVIILATASGRAVTSVEFQNRDRCADAQRQLIINQGTGIYAYCFKK